MNTGRAMTRFVVVLAILALAAPSIGSWPAAAVPESVPWTLYAADCSDPPPASDVVSCGDYGVFEINGRSSSCAVRAEGDEVPKLYGAPQAGGYQPGTPQQKSVARRPPPALDAVSTPVGQPATGTTTVPCEGGSCFSPPGGTAGGEPWIALLDWGNEHGWTTGWLAILTSRLPASLYALDGVDLTERFGPEVTDLHVLARLCEVAEDVDRRAVPPPVVLNMSFGRHFDPLSDADGPACAGGTLSCQIGRVLDHLAASGAAPVAAAGNYREMEFPAVYDGVISAGAMDLARLAASQEVAASWETPPAAQGLVPGYGVCMEWTDSAGVQQLWPAPPGSSYASSVLGGWIADTLTALPVADPAARTWLPKWLETSGCFLFSGIPEAPCNGVIERLFARILGSESENCWGRGADAPVLEVAVDKETAVSGVTEAVPSLSRWLDEQHKPAPGSNLCVPCASGGNHNESLRAAVAGHDSAVTPASALVLDLSSSSSLGSPYQLGALYLRIGELFYPLLEEGSRNQAASLDALGAGEVTGLLVDGVDTVLAPGDQPSLVFVTCDVTTGSEENCFWDSVPVLYE